MIWIDVQQIIHDPVSYLLLLLHKIDVMQLRIPAVVVTKETRKS